MLLKITVIFFLLSFSWSAHATEPQPCKAEDRPCLTSHLAALASQIDTDRWRDQTYRELAKTMAADGRALDALPYIEKIVSPDTKALTIRGIGVEAAMANQVPDNLFESLRAEAEKIEHEASYGIALTYIAMGQAFAGDDAGATKTAQDMENQALRNKAFAETAEIQADFGKFAEAMNSISLIDTVSFRNKAYRTVSKIFSDKDLYQQAFDTALKIDNPVMQAEAVQYLLDMQMKPKAEPGE